MVNIKSRQCNYPCPYNQCKDKHHVMFHPETDEFHFRCVEVHLWADKTWLEIVVGIRKAPNIWQIPIRIMKSHIMWSSNKLGNNYRHYIKSAIALFHWNDNPKKIVRRCPTLTSTPPHTHTHPPPPPHTHTHTRQEGKQEMSLKKYKGREIYV